MDIGLQANFETKTTLGINKLLMSLDSEIRLEIDIKITRISESGRWLYQSDGVRIRSSFRAQAVQSSSGTGDRTDATIS